MSRWISPSEERPDVVVRAAVAWLTDHWSKLGSGR
jgi:hypothetical protein